MDEKKGFYDFKKPEDIKRYVKEFNDARDEIVRKQNEIDDLKHEVMELRTENNDMTTAVTKTMKILYDEYYYGDLPMHNHDRIYNALKDAEI